MCLSVRETVRRWRRATLCRACRHCETNSKRFSGSAQCVIRRGLRKRPPSKKWTAFQGWPARAVASPIGSLRSASGYAWLRMSRIDVRYNAQLNLSRRLGNIIALQRRVLYLYYYRENVFRNAPCYMLSWERWWLLYICVCAYYSYIFMPFISCYFSYIFLFLLFITRKWNWWQLSLTKNSFDKNIFDKKLIALFILNC